MLRETLHSDTETSSLRSTIPATLLAVSFAFSMGLPAQADVFNPNIPISQADLKAKCKRSGGTWENGENGVTRCVVRNGDSTTVVECKHGKCDGYIFDNALIVAKRRHMSIGIIAPNNVIRPTR